VDLNIGRLIEFRNNFTFQPFVGASYFKLNVDNEINYTGIVEALTVPATFVGKLSDYSAGYGLNIGSSANWKLPCGFNLYGSGCYFIYRSSCHNKISQLTQVPSVPAEVNLNTRDDFYTLNQQFRLSCGISWDYPLCISSCPINLTIFAGYEFNYLPNQIELKRAQFSGSETSVIPLSTSGDVGFNGLTTGLSLRF